MADVLEKICARTRLDLELRIAQRPLDDVVTAAKDASPVRGFIKSLQQKHKGGKAALIAEVKKASPSKGLIREDFNPAEISKAYEAAGAACLSVLTDEPFFQGHADFLAEARNVCALPVLRKDFMIDPYQIYEARALGADCILLIVAALNDELMGELYSLSKNLGMDVLVEVHNQEELTRVLAISPEMIGVNNRNLKTLEVNIQTSHDLAKEIPVGTLKVAESGIYAHDDILKLQDSGFHTFLVGESLMREDNVEVATRTLLGTS